MPVPQVSFRVIEEDEKLGEPLSDTLRHYGFIDETSFRRPEHYIRYIEPIENELMNQVEYDMDDQDQTWLDQLNYDRKMNDGDKISYEFFEVIMDRLEKEWFQLSKLIPAKKSAMPADDSPCAICDDGEGENSNAIVFCDGCNLAVHQDCYGVPYIPEGQWLCRKCTVEPENPVSCIFCPNEGGAFKQTTTGRWSHLLCAIWIPEVGLSNLVYMEPVDGVEKVPKPRWKLNCSLCRQRYGACIQCSNKSCFTAFHVSCARENGLLSSMKAAVSGHGHAAGGDDSDGPALNAYCEKHLLPEMLAARVKSKSSKIHQRRKKSTTKSSQAYAKSYIPPPPIVPNKIVGSILDYVSRLNIRKKRETVERIARYWSLKREARRGAPLLKRLHLEPWTASSGTVQTDEERAKKLEYLMRVRNDLEKVRMLAELVRKREQAKLSQARIFKEFLELAFFPQDATLRDALEKIASLEKTDVFMYPVSKELAPDYDQFVRTPMCWSVIEEKINQRSYRNVEEFQGDVRLVFSNAMTYNLEGTLVHKLAERTRTLCSPILESLNSIKIIRGPGGQETKGAAMSVGNLDPSPMVMHMLQSTDFDTELRTDFINSLFMFAIEPPLPPSPPPPSPSRVQLSSNALSGEGSTVPQVNVDKGKKPKVTLRNLAGSLDSAPGFRIPRSSIRNARAHGSVFESASAGRPSTPDEASTPATKAKHPRNPKTPASAGPSRLTENDALNEHDMLEKFNTGWILPDSLKRSRPQSQKAREAPRPLKRVKVGAEARVHSKVADAIEDTSSLSSLSDTEYEFLPKSTASGFSGEDTHQIDERSATINRVPTPLVAHSHPKRSRDLAAQGPIQLAASSSKIQQMLPDVVLSESQALPTQAVPAFSPSNPDPTQLIDGTFVWATVGNYPAFPGRIVDIFSGSEAASRIPAALRATQEGKVKRWTIQFNDEQKTWTQLDRNKIQLFGMDEALDTRLANVESIKRKKGKSTRVEPKMRKQLLQSYEETVKIMRSEMIACSNGQISEERG